MSTELNVYVPGQPEEIDAQRVISGLGHVLAMLTQLAGGRRGTWQFSSLGLGSVESRFAVRTPPVDVQPSAVDDAFRSLIAGFDLTETDGHLPRQWRGPVLESARKAARDLGSAGRDGATLRLIHDGLPGAEVRITPETTKQIDAVVRTRHYSYGSVIGNLDSISAHDGNRASLWTELHNDRVEITFADELLAKVRDSLTERVEASGELTRDATGTPVALRLWDIRVLPRTTRSLSALLNELTVDSA